MPGPNWDALNQAARANEASRKGLEAVLTAFGALADRLDRRAEIGPTWLDRTISKAMAEEVRGVLGEFQAPGGTAGDQT